MKFQKKKKEISKELRKFLWTFTLIFKKNLIKFYKKFDDSQKNLEQSWSNSLLYN